MSFGLMLLTGCGSPNFVSPPPAVFLKPLPDTINGVWQSEEGVGQRVRLSGATDGVLSLHFLTAPADGEPLPAEPILAQTLHFDKTDWLLLDLFKLSAWTGHPLDTDNPEAGQRPGALNNQLQHLG